MQTATGAKPLFVDSNANDLKTGGVVSGVILSTGVGGMHCLADQQLLRVQVVVMYVFGQSP